MVREHIAGRKLPLFVLEMNQVLGLGVARFGDVLVRF